VQVSRLQVAELVTAAVLNPELAENKCLEVVAETTAPALALEALLESAATEITKVRLFCCVYICRFQGAVLMWYNVLCCAVLAHDALGCAVLGKGGGEER
jgi:hypothetical protein